MLYYTLDAAMRAPSVDRVVVVTEAEAVRMLAEGYGVEAVEDEPRDPTEPLTAVAAVRTALRQVRERFGRVVMLLPTSPLRTWKHVEEALRVHDADPSMNVVSCVSDEPRHGTLTFTNGCASWIKSPIPRSNGAIQIASLDRFMSEGVFVTRRTVPYFMDARVSVDVDTEDDLRLADRLLREGV